MNALIQMLVQADFDPKRIFPEASMARCTTMRTGGPADVLLQIASVQEIVSILSIAKANEVPVTIIGNGSNLLVRDGGIRGLVLRMGSAFSGIRREGDLLIAQAGTPLHLLAATAQREGLDGLSELSGIPGTIGGGVIMNAGAYGRELAQCVVRVEAIRRSSGKLHLFEGDALGFSYRHSALADADVIVTQVTLCLTPGSPQDIRQRTDALARTRREKQPLEYPSAGSTFKRPAGHFAAKLIDDCGLRGLRVGEAQVSEKHAGFIINLGHATASDVLTLMDTVTKRVYDQTGIMLEPEVRILGEEPISEAAIRKEKTQA